MEPLEFLRAVLPSAGLGHYCAFDGKTKAHIFKDSIEELLPLFTGMADKGHDAYYALGVFREKRRKQEHVVALRSLFVDLDGYDSPAVAWAALRDFLKTTGLWALGKPLGVISGGGLHAYWPLTADASPEDWEPIARNFKRLFVQEGVRIDMSVTADAARVLRPPTTLNFKYTPPAAVTLVKHELTAFDLREFGEKIASLLKDTAPLPTKSFELPGERIATDSIEMEIGKSRPAFFKNIVIKTEQGRGCAQLQWYWDNAASEGVEPLWRGLISLAKVCEDGVEHARSLTAMHPRPDTEFYAKWGSVGKPYYCETFNQQNPNVCPGCPHFGKIRTPIVLGFDAGGTAAPIETVIERAESTSEVEGTTVMVNMPEAPHHFEYNADRPGVRFFKSPDKKAGEDEGQWWPLINIDLWVEEVLDGPDGHVVYLAKRYNRADEPTHFNLTLQQLSSKDTAIKWLMHHGIFTSHDLNDVYLYRYVRACIAQAKGKPQKTPYHYGWQDDGSFVCAGRVFRKGRTPEKVPMVNLENVEDATRPKGTLEEWRTYVETCVIRKGLWKPLAVFLAGCASPLMRFTESSGMTVHCCSKESGTGKTLSLDLAASMWGRPKDYRLSSSTTGNALKQRLGSLNSLPLVVDEITSRNREGSDWFAEFLLSMTEGKGKERLEASSNRERRNLTKWNAVAVMSSNSRALSFLMDGRHTSDGELMRLIEIKMSEHLVWTEEERRMKSVLENNHGVAGCHYAQWLVDHAEDLPKWVASATEWAIKKLGLADYERNWAALLGAMVVAAKGLKDCGVLVVPMDRVLDVYRASIEELRAEMKENEQTPEDVVFDYIRAYYGQFVIIHKLDASANALASIGLPFKSRSQELATARDIMGRVERDAIPGYTDYYLPNKLLRRHCAEAGFDLTEVIAGLYKSDKMQVMPDRQPDMLTGTKAGGGTRVRCVMLRIKNDTATDVGLAAETATEKA